MTLTSETRPDADLVVIKDEELEAAIDSGMFIVRLATIHGRSAVRAYAYSISGEDPETAKAILKIVGREG